MINENLVRGILEDPAAYIRRHRAASGKRIVGTVCSYVPEEIILAAGAHPVRLLGSSEGPKLAGAHLQPYCCSLARGILEEGLSGRCDFLDGVVFSHTCDSMQRLSDIWRLNITGGFHLDAVWPVKLHTPSAQDYLQEILYRFREDMESSLETVITDEALKQSIQLTNTIRRALGKINRLCKRKPGGITAADFFALTRVSMIMDRDTAAALLAEEADRMEESGAPPESAAPKRLFLAGSVCQNASIYSLIESAGGIVAGDDFCTGTRYFEGLIDETVAPLDGIAKRLLQRPACPAKHAGLGNRAERLVQIAREADAQGVIFMLLKFCDPHAFDYPYLKQVFDSEGIPVMLLETDDASLSGGQTRTRIEAFLEML